MLTKRDLERGYDGISWHEIIVALLLSWEHRWVEMQIRDWHLKSGRSVRVLRAGSLISETTLIGDQLESKRHVPYGFWKGLPVMRMKYNSKLERSATERSKSSHSCNNTYRSCLRAFDANKRAINLDLIREFRACKFIYKLLVFFFQINFLINWNRSEEIGSMKLRNASMSIYFEKNGKKIKYIHSKIRVFPLYDNSSKLAIKIFSSPNWN